jgi:carbon storage regulator CsrA
MLVLTRKTDEEILIGDNIKITLVRVRGNSVRLGIEAPRDVRIVRGELDTLDSKYATEVEVELDDREQVFAHPQTNITGKTDSVSSNRIGYLMDEKDSAPGSEPNRSIFVGRIHRPETTDRTNNRPLAGFMSPR